jgi:hypothetical protein
MRAVVQTISGLILVHDDIENPMELILHPPMRAHHLSKAFGRQRRTQEVVGRLRRRLGAGFTRPDDLADGAQTGPLMLVLQPADRRRNHTGAGFDTAVISVHGGVDGGRLAVRIVEEQTDIGVQRALVSFERQGIVATLIDDLLGDVALAVERVDGHDCVLESKQFQELGHCGDFVRVGVGGDLREHEALIAAPGADHVQGRLGAGRIERPTQHFAVDRDDALAGLGKARHELLEAGTELVGIKHTEHPTEGVVRWQASTQSQELAKKLFFLLGQVRHIHARLAAAQKRAQRNQQHLVQIMSPGIARARILKTCKAFRETLHPILLKALSRTAVESENADLARKFRMRFPWNETRPDWTRYRAKGRL